MYSGYIGKIGYALRDLPKGQTVSSAVRVGDRIFQARALEDIWKNMEIKVVDADGPTLIVTRAYIEQDLMRDNWLYDGSYAERWEQGFRKKLYHGRTGAYFLSESRANVPFDKWTVPEIIKGDNPLQPPPWNNVLRMRNSIDGVTPDPLYIGFPKGLFRGVFCADLKLPSPTDLTDLYPMGFEVNSGGLFAFLVCLACIDGNWVLRAVDYANKLGLMQTVSLPHLNQYSHYALVYDPPYLELWEGIDSLTKIATLYLKNIRGKGIPFIANEMATAVCEFRVGNIWVYEILPKVSEVFQLFSGTVTSSGNTDLFDTGYFKQAEVCVDVTGVSGTSPSLTVYLEGLDEVSGKYKTIWNASFTSVGTQWLTITDLIFRYVRLRWTVSGTNPSFTFTCGMVVKS
jgi:hypothetical protein